MIGEILKAEMKKQSKSATYISKKTGIAEGNLSIILNDKTNPNIATVERIVTALDGKLAIVPNNGKRA